MKDKGLIYYCLGVPGVPNEYGVWIHQKQYVLFML